MEANGADWALRSGVWAQSDEGFALATTALGNPVSIHLSSSDIGDLLGTSLEGPAPSRQLPPEFRFSPFTGAPLRVRATDEMAGWVPPFGNPLASASLPSGARGLRQATSSLRFANLKDRTPDGEPDVAMDFPPPGDYQFFSGNFGTTACALIALAPANGALFLWLPASARWAQLDPQGERSLDDCDLPSHVWRAEVEQPGSGPECRIFVPTQSGLACVTPDAASLTYRVTHVGDAPAIGAPIAFDNQIWVPLEAGGGNVRFIGVGPDAQVQGEVMLAATATRGMIGLPVSYGRNAMWLCDGGQLRLQKQSDGTVIAAYSRWPEHVTPRFEFGSPYLAADGSLWQLGFNTAENSYVWVRVDRAPVETIEAPTPRLCSGSMNFRFATRCKTPPWQEPEHGDDTASNDFVIPILEAATGDAVIGVRLSSQAGIEETFRLRGRMPYTLYFDGDDSEVRFHSASLDEPWRTRLFAHDGILWAYHPFAKCIHGWRLA